MEVEPWLEAVDGEELLDELERVLGRFVVLPRHAAEALAAIGRLPETLADRCILIRMQRRRAGEETERLRNLEGAELRRRCARFAADHEAEIAQSRPAIPEGLNDRAGDIWEPLLALADTAGGKWPERAREAALGLSGAGEEHNASGGLLLDILRLFGEEWAERLFSRVGEETGRGYVKADVLEASERYIPPSELEAFRAEEEE